MHGPSLQTRTRARVCACDCAGAHRRHLDWSLPQLDLERWRPGDKRAWWICHGWLVDDVVGTSRPGHSVPEVRGKAAGVCEHRTAMQMWVHAANLVLRASNGGHARG